MVTYVKFAGQLVKTEGYNRLIKFSQVSQISTEHTD